MDKTTKTLLDNIALHKENQDKMERKISILTMSQYSLELSIESAYRDLYCHIFEGTYEEAEKLDIEYLKCLVLDEVQ